MYVRSMEEKREEEMRQQFRDDIKFFLSKDQFNLNDFHERVTVSVHLSNQFVGSSEVQVNAEVDAVWK